MIDEAMKLYVEARIAFVDRPDARISTLAHPQLPGFAIYVEEKIDGEWLQVSYTSQLFGHCDRTLDRNITIARRMRDSWQRELDKRAPSEPYDPRRLQDFMHGSAKPVELKVNREWDKQMLMWLDVDILIVSPAVYHEIARNRATLARSYQPG